MTTNNYINYTGNYKYQLSGEYVINVGISPKTDIETDYIDLDGGGRLAIKKGYAWDGASKPAPSTNENLRASLVHDALYQLMRHKKLVTRTHRKAADKIFKEICKQDGVSSISASIYYVVLRIFGEPAASPESKKIISRAPN